MTGRWVPHDTRDTVVDFVRTWSDKTDIPVCRFLPWVGIEHHESQPPVAFERVPASTDAGLLFFVAREPVVARHPGVVLVDLAEALLPVVELAGADADPGQEATSRDVRLVAPGADEIDDGIAAVVRHPAAL